MARDINGREGKCLLSKSRKTLRTDSTLKTQTYIIK